MNFWIHKTRILESAAQSNVKIDACTGFHTIFKLILSMELIFFLSVFSLGFAGVVTVGLYFVQNSTQNLVLSCIFEALTSLAISLVFCVLVDLFPTNLR